MTAGQSSSGEPTSSRLSRIFRALRGRNYRLYFVAQLLSTTGRWVQLVAENWLVLHLGGGGTALGLTNAFQFAPLLLFGPFGGVVVDRMDKRSLLNITQTLAGGLALTTGLLVVAGQIEIWMVWIAAFLLVCVNAVDTPAQQAFTRELSGPADVTNAVALNSAISTTGRAVGPAIGGVLLAAFGLAACFLINAATFLIVILALRFMHRGELHQEAHIPTKHGQVREGFAYVRKSPMLWIVLLVVAIASLFGFNFQVLLALLATQTFHRDGTLYGLLMSVFGAGAVLGSLLVASWNDPTIRRVGITGAVFGLALFGLSTAPALPFAFAAAGVLGIMFSVFLTSCSSYLQAHTGEGFRGRVMALYSVAFLGTAPIGGPLAGWIAEITSPRVGLLVGAIACAGAGVAVLIASGRETFGQPAPKSSG